MRVLMTVTAAIIAATAIASSASAEGYIGCDPGEPNASINARQCSVFNQRGWAYGPRAYAWAPRYRAAARRGYYGAPRRNYYGPSPYWGGY